MYAEKLGLSETVLQKTLWGDFFLNAKTKRIFKGAQVSLPWWHDIGEVMRFSLPAGQGQEAIVCSVHPGEPVGSLQGHCYGQVSLELKVNHIQIGCVCFLQSKNNNNLRVPWLPY